MKHIYVAVVFTGFLALAGLNPGYCQDLSDRDSQDVGIQGELRGALPSELKGNTQGRSEKPAVPAELAGEVTVSIEKDAITIDHMRGLLLKVSNTSKHPVMVDGDAAQVVLNTNTESGASLSDIERKGLPPTDAKAQIKKDAKDTLTAAFTVGAVQAIEGIKMQHGPILDRYGTDEKRRQQELVRFGKRILWPGEVSTGTIYFNTEISFSGGTLEIPLSLPFSGNKAHVATISSRIQE